MVVVVDANTLYSKSKLYHFLLTVKRGFSWYRSISLPSLKGFLLVVCLESTIDTWDGKKPVNKNNRDAREN